MSPDFDQFGLTPARVCPRSNLATCWPRFDPFFLQFRLNWANMIVNRPASIQSSVNFDESLSAISKWPNFVNVGQIRAGFGQTLPDFAGVRHDDAQTWPNWVIIAQTWPNFRTNSVDVAPGLASTPQNWTAFGRVWPRSVQVLAQTWPNSAISGRNGANAKQKTGHIGVPDSVEVQRGVDRPTHRPADRPAGRRAERTSAHPSAGPTARPIGRLLARPTDRWTARPRDRPAELPSDRPSARRLAARPPAGRPGRRPTGSPADHPPARSSARPPDRPARAGPAASRQQQQQHGARGVGHPRGGGSAADSRAARGSAGGWGGCVDQSAFRPHLLVTRLSRRRSGAKTDEHERSRLRRPNAAIPWVAAAPPTPRVAVIRCIERPRAIA